MMPEMALSTSRRGLFYDSIYSQGESDRVFDLIPPHNEQCEVLANSLSPHIAQLWWEERIKPVLTTKKMTPGRVPQQGMFLFMIICQNIFNEIQT